MSEPLQKFQHLLRELFRTEHADLNFGIYRVLRYRSERIEEFIRDRLPELVEEAFEEYSAEEQDELVGRAEELKQRIQEMARQLGQEAFAEDGTLREDFKSGDLAQEYLDVQARLDESKLNEEMKSGVYNDLYRFFKRYYDDGDIMPRPRKGRVEIPYSGNEDVSLHWANRNQYYIKTNERFSSYQFECGDYTIIFGLSEVRGEENSSRRRYYLLADESPLQYFPQAKLLRVNFVLRELSDEEKNRFGKTEQQKPQQQVNESYEEKILDQLKDSQLKLELARGKSGSDFTVLQHHLTKFTHINRSDFFIHRDVKGFLTEELDHFLKAEVLKLGDVFAGDDPPSQLQIRRAKVISRIAHQVIDFIAQIENFQCDLFEKKKFVLSTDYCVTLDQIPDSLLSSIANNESQIREWQSLYGLAEFQSGDVSASKLKSYPYLVLDTKHFSEDFKWELLSHYNNLDYNIDGVLMRSENFQALNLLLAKYRSQVKCVYIDPPYNTGKDDFLYKDNYRHSSWLSMMADRLGLARELLRNDGVIFTSIDDNEAENLKKLMQMVYGDLIANFIWNSEGHTDNQFPVKINHEYIQAFSLNRKATKLGYVVDPNTPADSNLWKGYAENSITKNGSRNPPSEITLPEGFPASVDELHLEPTQVDPDFYSAVAMQGYISRGLTQQYDVDQYPIRKDPLVVKNGVLEQPCRVFSGWANVEKLRAFIESGLQSLIEGDGSTNFYLSENGVIYYRKEREGARNILSVLRNMGTTEQMRSELERMGLEYQYPKPKDLISHIIKVGSQDQTLVLDFFAGSGTTAHSIIDLQRSNNESRKYILVEMGDSFDTVLLPRIKKTIFSSTYDGVQPGDTNGVSQFIKYHQIEQYEDVLNNLDFPNAGQGQLAFDQFGDEYLIKYMLHYENRDSCTMLNLQDLKDPFNYKLRRLLADNTNERSIDLVETLNYLLGLVVIKQNQYENAGQKYRVVLGERDDQTFVIVWRDLNDKDRDEDAMLEDKAFIEGTIFPDFLGDLSPDHILVNGACAVEGAQQVEAELQRLLFREGL